MSIESVIQADTNGNVRIADPSTDAPGIPRELWMLWREDGEDQWVVAVDDNAYVVCLSHEEAILSAEYQASTWGIDCRPVRVK